MDFVRPGQVDLSKFPVRFLQFHIDRDALAKGYVRVSLLADTKKHALPPDGIAVTASYLAEDSQASQLSRVCIPMEAFGPALTTFYGLRFAAPSAPADVWVFIDEIQLLKEPPPQEGTATGAATSSVPHASQTPTSSPGGPQVKVSDEPRSAWLPMLAGSGGAILFSARRKRLQVPNPASCLEISIYLGMMVYGVVYCTMWMLSRRT